MQNKVFENFREFLFENFENLCPKVFGVGSEKILGPDLGQVGVQFDFG